MTIPDEFLGGITSQLLRLGASRCFYTRVKANLKLHFFYRRRQTLHPFEKMFHSEINAVNVPPPIYLKEENYT